MVAMAAERYGVHALGIGSDLCRDQPDSVVEWMRNGAGQLNVILVKAVPINRAFRHNRTGLKE